MDERDLELRAARQGYAWRMSLGLRIQHIFFGLCLLALSLSGLALLLGDSDFGRWLIALEGGFENRGLLHRVAAVGLIFSVLFHLGYSLFSDFGSREFRRRKIGRRDLRQFSESLRFAFGGRSSPPAAGKYTFGQKLHYWLAGALSATMIVSGLVLWSPTAAMAVLPPWALQLLRKAHGNEGLLFFIIVILWHIYGVHLSPRNFPMSMVWLTGRMPLSKAERYHRREYERLSALAHEGDD